VVNICSANSITVVLTWRASPEITSTATKKALKTIFHKPHSIEINFHKEIIITMFQKILYKINQINILYKHLFEDIFINS